MPFNLAKYQQLKLVADAQPSNFLMERALKRISYDCKLFCFKRIFRLKFAQTETWKNSNHNPNHLSGKEYLIQHGPQ